MRKYETIFVLNANVEEEKRNELIQKFAGIINSNGEVIKIDEWGNKKLSYEIQKMREGYYVLVEYNANTDLPKELERNLKITDEVIRYMTTKL